MSSIYNNPELEMMAKEIQAMLVEKLQIEKECQVSSAHYHFLNSLNMLWCKSKILLNHYVPKKTSNKP